MSKTESDYSWSMESTDTEFSEAEREIKIYFLFLSSIFLISGVMGFYGAQLYPEIASDFVNQLFEGFSFIDFNNPLMVVTVIFLNNASKSFVSLLAGFFFGIFPFLFIFLNGYLLGIVFYVKGMEVGIGKVFLAIIPHGILEVPAIILASAFGVWLGKKFYLRVFKGQQVNMSALVKYSIKRFVKIIIPLLLIAAIVETFITPLIVFLF
jgi:stage II sporulation protein M